MIISTSVKRLCKKKQGQIYSNKKTPFRLVGRSKFWTCDVRLVSRWPVASNPAPSPFALAFSSRSLHFSHHHPLSHTITLSLFLICLLHIKLLCIYCLLYSIAVILTVGINQTCDCLTSKTGQTDSVVGRYPLLAQFVSIKLTSFPPF